MNTVGKHAILTLVALVGAIGLLAWIDPAPAAAPFLVAASVLTVNAIGAFVGKNKKNDDAAILLITIASQGALLLSVAACTPSIPTRTFLTPAEIPAERSGGYAIYAMPSLPVETSRGRMTLACKAFLASLPDDGSVPSAKARIMTIWPVQRRLFQSERQDCDKLLTIYELPVGVTAIADAKMAGLAPQGRGPFLIAWAPNDPLSSEEQPALLWDLSHASTEEEFMSALRIWQDIIMSDPNEWRSGFRMEAIRLRVQAFVNKWGPMLMDRLPGLSSSKGT